jgi:hypothetical protein
VSEITRTQFLDETNRLSAAVIAAQEPYEAGIELWRLGMVSVSAEGPIGEWGHCTWLIWGSLTDGIDGPPHTPELKARATDGMRRAAREWLDLPPHDDDARRSYLDRWVYEECGTSVPSQADPQPNIENQEIQGRPHRGSGTSSTLERFAVALYGAVLPSRRAVHRWLVAREG